jgi:hypothetical protein
MPSCARMRLAVVSEVLGGEESILSEIRNQKTSSL